MKWLTTYKKERRLFIIFLYLSLYNQLRYLKVSKIPMEKDEIISLLPQRPRPTKENAF